MAFGKNHVDIQYVEYWKPHNIVEVIQLLSCDIITTKEARVLLQIDKKIQHMKEGK